MSAAAALICLVTGEAAGGLPTDTVVLLCDALTRAGELAALAAGGPVAKGAAPAAAGRCVALARYDAVTGVAECLYSPSFASPPGTGGGATAAAAGGGGGQQQPLFSPTPLPLDLRRWAAAARAAATPPAVAPGARAPPVRPPPAPGSCCALDALDALLLVAAPCKWTRPGAAPAGSVQLTLLCTLPQRHVAEELLAPLLGAANQQARGARGGGGRSVATARLAALASPARRCRSDSPPSLSHSPSPALASRPAPRSCAR